MTNTSTQLGRLADHTHPRGTAPSGRTRRGAGRATSGAAQRAYARRRTRSGAQTPRTAPRQRGTLLATRVSFAAVILALLGGGLALTLLLTTRAAQDSYQLSAARERNQSLLDERAVLQREVAAAAAAPELATRARELGMIPVQDPARLLVGPDGRVAVVGEPTPAQGAPAPPLNPEPVDPDDPAAQSPGERIVPVPAPGAPQRNESREHPERSEQPAPREEVRINAAPAPREVPMTDAPDESVPLAAAPPVPWVAPRAPAAAEALVPVPEVPVR